ncbi:MAG: sigma-70 family RNA polymerase sigma factor [Pirellulales bacterium]|nr:sigma-70 family RNA polymerase sigma factor [Pirellulales bacterium]
MPFSRSHKPRDDDRTEQFLRLLSAHEDRTKAFIYSLLPNWADAEDVAQEVRLKLWEQFDRYDPSKDFGAWSRTIAHYHVLAFRKRARRRRQLSPQLLELVAETFDAQAERLEARARVLKKCIDALSESKRRMLLRCYRGKETIRQVAALAGRSYEALRKSLLRTRRELAQCVERELNREDSP